MIKKGRFKKVGETLSVPAGETLELRCRGKPVQWSVPTYLQEDHEGRLKYATFTYCCISPKETKGGESVGGLRGSNILSSLGRAGQSKKSGMAS